MSDPIRVAVFGAGHLGSIHARILSELDDAHLVAIVDPKIERARALAERFGCAAFANRDGLPKIQAAVVATPTLTHRDVGLALMEDGIDVLIEKPIALDVAQARELVDAAEQKGRVLMVGHSERFNPVIVAIDRYQLRPRFIDSQRVSPFTFRSTDVGVVLDMMIHDIDIILHLVNSPVKAVHAVGVPVIGATEDLANARIVFENGAVANATASRVALKTERIMRMFSSEAYATLDYHKKVGRLIKKGAGLREPGVDLEKAFAAADNPLAFMQQKLVEIEQIEIPEVEPLRAENEAFLAAVRSREDPPVTGRHGLLAVDVASRIAASMRESLAATEDRPPA